MKKIIFIILCISVYKIEAQSYGSSLGVNAGYAEDGIGIMAEYNYYVSRFNSVHISGYMSFANYKYEDIDVPYALYSLQVGYTQNIWRNHFRRNIKISGLGGVQVGYESINNGKESLWTGDIVTSESKIIYGAYLGAEIDLLLGDDFSFIIRANENFHINSDVGNLTMFAGIGIRYYIY
ncbi:conjugal transfer protein TraO [Abyssalbus ytuae]|uniref:Conjugal transfer protein TraO n=1 Tax=Abyssalbus ytuae TaxID=2926907 RepID=A0A9E6ZLA6_9FLAO|nr:conjugal transfer protein TraO [Abyssalbus ytuae]UOB16699.1 conjugal transfer protein TraO [Abyssalbus ytuae]